MLIENQEKKNKTIISIENIIFPSLSKNIRASLEKLDRGCLQKVEEIRIRENRPLMLSLNNKDYMLTKDGKFTNFLEDSYIVKKEDTANILQLISDYSLYAIEEELRNGFITLKGGHRVGLTGKAVLENGKIRTLKYISGFNFRISKEIKGVANPVISYIRHPEEEIYHTLIISPPQCGKTTLLRDLIRQISNGNEKNGFKGYKVGIVDERSELAGCYKGVPQNDIGIRTDVLDACPKAQGMIMLIRSMSPHIIATDEIGSREDMEAIEEALNAGIKLITTVHGKNIDEIIRKPVLREIIQKKIFQRMIVLSNRKGPGTIEEIIEGITLKKIK
ncbi:stage III sporulation protein AA [Garciella nitratireducens]|uniref:Stage III sporulation protein AA n=1 Tax=Garciella nitratireducens DSM 15102 TaxID=1121911 RepID=A0A1T4K4C8_9FIRM|nr:stage III sporulation protein AA [Garciella nitratireducens]SJZ37294.1 stage III sporulation protein AA [Garciella nitratireducens DSM 15102]